MIITVANEKGGSGKTTLSLNLCSYLAEDGDKVMLIDADPQKSTSVFCNNRADSNLEPLFSAIQKTGSSLRDEIVLQHKNYDTLVIDTSGRDSNELRIAMARSNCLLIPAIPSQLDVTVLEHMLDVYDMTKNSNPNLKAFIVFNRVSPNVFLSKDIQDLKDFIDAKISEKRLEDIVVLNSIIYERRIFKKAIETGETLKEYAKNNSDKAVVDFDNFCKEFVELASK